MYQQTPFIIASSTVQYYSKLYISGSKKKRIWNVDNTLLTNVGCRRDDKIAKSCFHLYSPDTDSVLWDWVASFWEDKGTVVHREPCQFSRL